jgi:hypothetical protein
VLREAERLLLLAADAAQARAALLERGAEAPGAALYGLARGGHPLVDLEGAVHLVEVVGADQAAALLLPEGRGPARGALRVRLLAHLHRRLQQESAARGLRFALAEGLSPEAARRFARQDAERYPGVSGWWAGEEEPTYAGAAGLGPRREPLHPERLRGQAQRFRVRHRVAGEQRPPLEDLVHALEEAERDREVLEYSVDPWPRRLVRRAGG